MALHSKKQLAEICGLDYSLSKDRGKIGMAIQRGKLILSGDFIDDTIPENTAFIAKQQLIAVNKEPVPVVVDDTEGDEVVLEKNTGPNYRPPEKRPAKAPNVALPKQLGEPGFLLDRELKQQELEKKQVETRLLNLKEQKQRGELIPTDLVKVIFTQHSKSIVTEFKNTLDQMLTIFTKKHSLGINEVAEMRGELLGAINTAVSKSIDHSKKNLELIINEFTETKGVGEHG